MVAKVIKTDRDYEVALNRIEELMDARPGTAEGDELELLAALVEAYEDKNYPIAPPDPIDAIRFRMEQAGLKQKDLVPYIGSRPKVSEVLSGKRTLSLKMIRALHEGLGIPAEVLLREPGAVIPENVPGLRWGRFPIAEMLRRGWFPEFTGPVAEAKERAEELLRDFLQPLTRLQPAFSLSRRHVRSGARTDEYAFQVWQARVIALAQQQEIADYAQGRVTPEFMRRVAQLSYLDEGPRLAREFLAKAGIHFVVVAHLPKTHLDGFATVLPSGHPLIAQTLRHDRLDNFWFTLCHELAHVALHLSDGEHDCFVDEVRAEGDELEDEADRFAADALISPERWKEAVHRGLGRPSVERLAEELRIHPAIVAGRIRREAKNYKLLTGLVGQGCVRRLFPEGDFGAVSRSRS